jgi:hypothetical protein
VRGKAAPTRLYPAPEMVAALTVTGEEPVEVRMRGNVAGELSVTLPKLSWVRLRDNCGFGAGMPVPLRGIGMELPRVASVLIVS